MLGKDLPYVADCGILSSGEIHTMEENTNPIAILVDTQLGTARTALLDYTKQLSSRRKFYEINPEMLLGDSDNMINYFRNCRRNLILHQDLTDLKAVDQAIVKFNVAGYTVGVRALAASALDNKMSQIEALNIGRFVSTADHDAAFKFLPHAVNYLEAAGKCDFIEIFKQGTRQREPELVYAKFNEATKAQTLDALADCENVSHRDHNYRFANAQAALDKTRRLETIRCAPTIPARIRAVEAHALDNSVIYTNLDKLKTHLSDYQHTCKLTKCTVHAMATAKRIDDNSRTI